MFEISTGKIRRVPNGAICSVFPCFCFISTSFVPPVAAQVDFRLKTNDGNVSLFGKGETLCSRGGLDGCTVSQDTRQNSGTLEFIGFSRVTASAQTLSVSGQLAHSGIDQQYVGQGGAVASYTALLFADIPPGVYASVVFRRNISLQWSMNANEVHGDTSGGFTPYPSNDQVGGGFGVTSAPSGNPSEVLFSTVTAMARAPSPYAGANGGTLVDGGTTYYYIGRFNTFGRIEIFKPEPAGGLGGYSSSIDNIEVRRIGKVLKKLPAGDAQTGLVTKPLPKGLNVRVINDDTGIPVANEPVSFTVVAPGHNASLSATPVTDLNGYATAYLTLGTSTGTYTVRATCPSCIAEENTVFFMATAKGIELREIPGDGTSPIGRQTLNPLKVQAYNPITNSGEAGYTVDFSVFSTPAGGETAKLATSQSITNGFGNASSAFTLGESIGDYTIKARCESCLDNPEVFLTVTGITPVEHTHSSGGGDKTTYTPTKIPGEIGVLEIGFQNLAESSENFMKVAGDDSRIGVMRTDTEMRLTKLRFTGIVTPADQNLKSEDYKWSGVKSDTRQTIEVEFPDTGTKYLTLEVKGKRKTVEIKVEDIEIFMEFADWLRANPTFAPIVLGCGLEASVWQPGYPTYNVADAMKHAYWSACLRFRLGANIAKEAADAREYWGLRLPNGWQVASVMDLENNAKGRIIGAAYSMWVVPSAIQDIEYAAKYGALTVINQMDNDTGQGLLVPSR